MKLEILNRQSVGLVAIVIRALDFCSLLPLPVLLPLLSLASFVFYADRC
jgi:hypothetical protein